MKHYCLLYIMYLIEFAEIEDKIILNEGLNMHKTKIDAHAKINLSIDVLNKRPDSYHEVKMIMQTIELCDKLVICKTEKGVCLSSNKQGIPENSKNIAYKAAELMIEKYKIESGVFISLNKNIPVSAGLAGGSADAAAVLKGMNRLFKLSLKKAELAEIGATLGADVPFCVKGGTALAEGIGGKLKGIKKLKSQNILIIKPKTGISTGWVYDNIKQEEIKVRPDIKKLVSNIRKDEIDLMARDMVNVLETVTVKRLPIIQKIKELMIENHAMGSIMSGSGPSVFGIFPDEETAKAAQNSIMKNEAIINKCESYLTMTR